MIGAAPHKSIPNWKYLWNKQYRRFLRHSLWFPSKKAVLASPRFVLHLVPLRCVEEDRRHLGSTKDIAGRWQFLRERGIPTLVFPGILDEADPLMREMARRIFIKLTQQFSFEGKEIVVFLDAPGSFPSIAQTLKSRCPNVRVVFRAHNAELLHRIERLWVTRGEKQKRRLLGRVFKQVFYDLRMVRRSEVVLPISDADHHSYWRHLLSLVGARPRTRIETLPYFMPDEYLREPPARKEKENLIVCISSGKTKEGRVDDGIPAFLQLAAAVRERLPGGAWRFVVTGGTEGEELAPGVHSSGFLASPLDILVKAKLACVLSNQGWGFKTKILDAIVADTHVLLTRKTLGRVPMELRIFCSELDLSDIGGFLALLEGLETAERTQSGLALNRRMRDKSYEVLDKLLAFGSDGVAGERRTR